MEAPSDQARIWIVEKQETTKPDEELLQPLFEYINQRFHIIPHKILPNPKDSPEKCYFVLQGIKSYIQTFLETSLKGFEDTFADFVGKILKSPPPTGIVSSKSTQNWMVIRVILPKIPGLDQSVELFNQIFPRIGIQMFSEVVEDGFVLFFREARDFHTVFKDFVNSASIAKWCEQKGIPFLK